MYEIMKIKIAWLGYTMQEAKRATARGEWNIAPPHPIVPSHPIPSPLLREGYRDFRLHYNYDRIVCALNLSLFSMRYVCKLNPEV